MVRTLQLEDLQQIYAPQQETLGFYNRWIVLSSALTEEEISGEVVPATRLLEPDFLREKISEYGKTIDTTDLKVAASIWTKRYNLILFPLALSAMALGGVGLDFSLANLTVVFKKDDHGEPGRFILNDLSKTVVYPARCPSPELVARILNKVNSPTELQAAVFANLFGQNVDLLVEAMANVSRLSKKISYGNMGTTLFSVYQVLAEKLAIPAARDEDGPAILDQPHNPLIGPDKNPFYKPVRLVTLDDPELPGPAQIRATCCLWYKSPQGRLCNGCPLLKPAEMIERWKIIFSGGH